MHKKPLTALWLIFALAISGCASTGRDAPQPVSCPEPQPVPSLLMQPPSYGQQARAILFDSPTSAMPTSGDSKP